MIKLPTILDIISVGECVTIVDQFGEEKTGRSLMRGPAGWVLAIGDPKPTPGIGREDNIINVKPKNRAK